MKVSASAALAVESPSAVRTCAAPRPTAVSTSLLDADVRVPLQQRIRGGRIEHFELELVGAAVRRRDRARHDPIDPFARRNQPRDVFGQELVGGDLPGDAERVAPRKGGDERRAFDTDRHRLLEQPLELLLPGAVVEIRDQNRDRLGRTGRRRRRAPAERRPAGEPQRQHRDAERDRREPGPRRRAAGDNRVAVGGQSVQRRDQIRGRQKPLVRGRFDAARDDPLERIGNAVVELTQRRRRVLHPRHDFRHRVVAARRGAGRPVSMS